jgi:hypothetical protein
MSWNCAQLEARLDDYLEARLPTQEATAAQAHIDACVRCAEWAEARQATLWLRQVEPLETPPGLETRILAQTLAPAPEESFWSVLELGWRALLQPRMAMGLAAALISFGLVLNAVNVSPGDISVADLNPVNVYRSLNRQAQLTYANGVRFVNDLRLVYEIRSRLEEMQGEPEEAPASAPSESAPPSNDEDNREQNFPDGAQAQWLLAYQTIGMLGELR